MDAFALVSSAAHSGAFGINNLPEPSLACLRAGNYLKGRVTLHGLRIAIETPQGQRRTGKANGEPWSVICQAHYGYIEKTRGADGDELDVFIGPWPESVMAYVVNRGNGDGGFDEHKLLLGFPDRESAITAYRNSYERGADNVLSVVPCSLDQLKWWIKLGNHTIPLTTNHLPFDGTATMNDVTWDAAANPVGLTLPQLLYAIRRNDADDRLLLDAVTTADVLEASEGEAVLDALVVPLNRLERKMGQMQVIMRAAGKSVRPGVLQVTPPFKQRGTTNVAAIFEMDDGQTVTVYFHNPDATPNKLTPDDEMVSWKWMLNKKDVTIVVAPERGRELNPREVARRIMRLVESNSDRFKAANTRRAERMAAIETGKASVASKQAELDALHVELAGLEERVEAKRSTPPATLQTNDGAVQEFVDAGFNRVQSNDYAKAVQAGQHGLNFNIRVTPDGYRVSVTGGKIEMGNARSPSDAIGMIEREVQRRTEQYAPAVVADTLPPGWSESTPGGMATNRDPIVGGIVDRYRGDDGGWFVIPNNDAIPRMMEGFPTRAAAFAALAAGVAGLSVDDSDLTQQLVKLIREAKGGVSKLATANYFTFEFEGDDMIFGDDLRTQVEAALGEKVKEVVLPGLEGQLSIVPESFVVPGDTAKGVIGGMKVGLKKDAAEALIAMSIADYRGVKGRSVPNKIFHIAAEDGHGFEYGIWSKREMLELEQAGYVSVTRKNRTGSRGELLVHADITEAGRKEALELIGDNLIGRDEIGRLKLVPPGSKSYDFFKGIADEWASAYDYLQSVIDGTVDLSDPAVSDKLAALHERHSGKAEFDDLFAKAAEAFQTFMVAAAKKAMG